MKKLCIPFLAMAAFILLSSFKGPDVNTISGTYGVSPSDPSQITLIIQPDHSFSYQDFSNSRRKIKVTGRWDFNGDKIILKSEDPAKFHRVWKIVDEGRAAKSKRGLTFYRLVKKT